MNIRDAINTLNLDRDELEFLARRRISAAETYEYRDNESSMSDEDLKDIIVIFSQCQLESQYKHGGLVSTL